jgi:tRNA (cmo5U34)-methyltransferase
MKVGDDIEVQRANWSFSGDVPKNFVGHAEKSIPGYQLGHELVCQLSDYFVQPNSVCYEIGTSTGQLLRRLAEHHSHKPETRWIGLDREEKMIEEAQKHCAGLDNVAVFAEDFLLHDVEKADFVAAYYTLQFVPPRHRQTAFDKIYEMLNWGGAFVMFEKVRAPDARFQDIATTLYTDFKIGQGLSAEEIVNKTASLKSVLEPFSTQGNLDLLARAGFTDTMTVFKWVCFEGFLAIK